MDENLNRVIDLSRNCHKRVKQFRKYTGEPYEVHPAEVAAYGVYVYPDYKDEITLSAFLAMLWLHDCIEDTDCTWDEIRQAIRDYPLEEQSKILTGVSLLTDPSDPGLNREQRQVLQTSRLANAPRYVQGGKLCDNYCNIKSIAVQDPDFARTIYMKEKITAYESFSDDHPIAFALVKTLVDEVRSKLDNPCTCPQCSNGELVERNKDLAVMKNGLIIYIRDVPGKHCTRCAHAVLQRNNMGPQERAIIKAAKNNSQLTII